MNTGAPMTAVTAPTGISAGAMIVRASVSARIRNMPPSRNEAGSNSRWSGPKIIRVTWGMMSPTNPTTPLTDTTAPVMTEAMA